MHKLLYWNMRYILCEHHQEITLPISIIWMCESCTYAWIIFFLQLFNFWTSTWACFCSGVYIQTILRVIFISSKCMSYTGKEGRSVKSELFLLSGHMNKVHHNLFVTLLQGFKAETVLVKEPCYIETNM